MGGLTRRLHAPGIAALVVVAFALGNAAAQDPADRPIANRVQFVDLPSDAVLVAVAFAGGYDDAPLQPALAEVRWRAAAAAGPEVRQSSMRLLGDAAVLFAIGDPRDAVALAGWVRRALAPLPLDDDVLALASARAARLADDAAHVYPGEVLASRARVRLGGRASWAVPLRGDPKVLLGASPSHLRDELERPAPATVLVLGAIPPELRDLLQDLTNEPWPLVSAGKASAERVGTGEAGAGWPRIASHERHERVDAPFIAAAFATPPGSAAALALGLEVARARAARRFGARRSGVLARAPYVDWTWLDAAPVVLFHRRGRDPVDRWPGEPLVHDGAWELAQTQAELVAFLDDLRTVAPSATELAEARRGLLAELALAAEQTPPKPVPAALLPGRALAVLFAARRGLDVASVGGVDEAAVAGALLALLVPERASFHALLPIERADRHWSAR